jgi:hypothetical protein
MKWYYEKDSITYCDGDVHEELCSLGGHGGCEINWEIQNNKMVYQVHFIQLCIGEVVHTTTSLNKAKQYCRQFYKNYNSQQK